MTLIIGLIHDSEANRLHESEAKKTKQKQKNLWAAKVELKQGIQRKAEFNPATDDTGYPTQD